MCRAKKKKKNVAALKRQGIHSAVPLCLCSLVFAHRQARYYGAYWIVLDFVNSGIAIRQTEGLNVLLAVEPKIIAGGDAIVLKVRLNATEGVGQYRLEGRRLVHACNHWRLRILNEHLALLHHLVSLSVSGGEGNDIAIGGEGARKPALRHSIAQVAQGDGCSAFVQRCHRWHKSLTVAICRVRQGEAVARRAQTRIGRQRDRRATAIGEFERTGNRLDP